MPNAARGSASDTVKSATGSGYKCKSPVETTTNECSPNVFVNGVGSVRQDDKVTEHIITGCNDLESPGLTAGSPNVFVNGKQMGRKGDDYVGDGSNIIVTGSDNVFVNG